MASNSSDQPTTASPSAFRGQELIIALAAKHQLPAVYPFRLWVGNGGLMSQAHVTLSQFEKPLHETHAAAFRLHDEQHGQGHASRNEQAHRVGPAGPASP